MAIRLFVLKDEPQAYIADRLARIGEDVAVLTITLIPSTLYEC